MGLHDALSCWNCLGLRSTRVDVERAAGPESQAVLRGLEVNLRKLDDAQVPECHKKPALHVAANTAPPADAAALPSELLEIIFEHLGARALAAAAGVCRNWRRSATSDALWYKLFARSALRAVSSSSRVRLSAPPFAEPQRPWFRTYLVCSGARAKMESAFDEAIGRERGRRRAAVERLLRLVIAEHMRAQLLQECRVYAEDGLAEALAALAARTFYVPHGHRRVGLPTATWTHSVTLELAIVCFDGSVARLRLAYEEACRVTDLAMQRTVLALLVGGRRFVLRVALGDDSARVENGAACAAAMRAAGLPDSGPLRQEEFAEFLLAAASIARGTCCCRASDALMQPLIPEVYADFLVQQRSALESARPLLCPPGAGDGDDEEAVGGGSEDIGIESSRGPWDPSRRAVSLGFSNEARRLWLLDMARVRLVPRLADPAAQEEVLRLAESTYFICAQNAEGRLGGSRLQVAEGEAGVLEGPSRSLSYRFAVHALQSPQRASGAAGPAPLPRGGYAVFDAYLGAASEGPGASAELNFCLTAAYKKEDLWRFLLLAAGVEGLLVGPGPAGERRGGPGAGPGASARRQFWMLRPFAPS
eukprot:tig00001000_g6176.t1